MYSTKCKELRIHFGRDELDFSNIRVNGSNLEIVNHVKIVALTISNDLKWNQHVNNIVKKANKRIYFIIQLKRAKIPPSEILLFYCTCVRPTLGYSTQVFHYALPNYLQWRSQTFIWGGGGGGGEANAEDVRPGREGVETAIHRASPSVMRASPGVRRSNCKQIWLRVHDPSEGMLKLLLYKILLV